MESPHSDSASQENRRLKIKKNNKPAAGPSAVFDVLKRTATEMGLIRGTKILLQANQKGGFDCPGCAWPEAAERDLAEFCENGAKAIASEATYKTVTPAFFETWKVSDLLKQSDHWLEQQGRIAHPMHLSPGSDHYEAISWDKAFDLLGKRLKNLDSPNRAVFYTSGRTSNEAAFLFQTFAREFGTNNLPDCSNMCHESSGVALGQTIGISKGTVSLEDFDLADLIFVIGQNPGTNHPRMLKTLESAARRGCHIVSINPLKEKALVSFANPQFLGSFFGGGTDICESFLRVRINGDVALLKGIMKEVLIEEEKNPGKVLDHHFISKHTSGFEEFAKSLKEQSWDRIVEESGISREEIQRTAKLYMDSQRVIACWAMGLTQHLNAVDNIREVLNLLLLRGNLGRPGAGVCPVRGHSNVQGDRTMGILPNPKKEFLDALKREFAFTPPVLPGYDTVASIEAMAEGKVDVFFALGGNFYSASPDSHFTEKALRNCGLTAHVSTKLNRSHLVTGKEALILPCLGRTEMDEGPYGPQFVTVENSMRVVTASQGRLSPVSPHLKSEVAIVCGLAEATFGSDTNLPWEEFEEDYDRIRDFIEKVIPGFDQFNERVRVPEGFVLPNPASERTFKTLDGKAQFSVNELSDIRLQPGEFLMMTIRSHDQFNTTIYGLNDRYRGIYNGRRVVLMNPEDMKVLGIKEKEPLNLSCVFEGQERRAEAFLALPYDIPNRCVATYFPEANVLVPIQNKARQSNTPCSKSIVIRIEKM